MNFQVKNIPAAVIDLEGTLLENDSYENLLLDISQRSSQTFHQLMRRYRTNWLGLDEAQRFHERIVGEANAEFVRERYARFTLAKSHPTVLKGTRGLLELLLRQKKHRICWTRGDEQKQLAILRESALDHYFDVILVPGSKDSLTVQSILLPALGGRDFFVVGDSYDQDIVPLLEYAKALFWIEDTEANRIAGEVDRNIDSRVTRIKDIGALLALFQARAA